MKKVIQYRCDYCDSTYDKKECALLCEENCKVEGLKLQNISNRIRTLSPDQYIYSAKDLDDVEDLFELRFHGYADDYEYEDFKYPCKVIIFEYLDRVPYEDYYETYYNVKQLDEYIDTLISAR